MIHQITRKSLKSVVGFFGVSVEWHEINGVFSNNFVSIVSVLTSQTVVRRKCSALHKVVNWDL